MQDFEDFAGSSTKRAKPPKWVIVCASLAAVAVSLLCVSIKLKASTPPNTAPSPVLVQQASAAPPPSDQTQSTISPPAETAPVPTAETAPVPPTDTPPVQSGETAPDQTSQATSDQTSDPAPDQPSASASDQAPAVELSAMTITPGSVYAGDAFTIAVTLSAPAPSGGASVDLSLGDTAQDPIEIPEGETSGSVSYHAGSNSGTETFTCSYGGSTYNTDLTVMDIPDCMDAIDDDTPCTDSEGNTITHGEWKEREQQQMDQQEQMRERVNEETNP